MCEDGPVGAEDSRRQGPMSSPCSEGGLAAIQFPREAEPSGSGGTMSSRQLLDQGHLHLTFALAHQALGWACDFS